MYIRAEIIFSTFFVLYIIIIIFKVLKKNNLQAMNL